MAFPTNPTDEQYHDGYLYNASTNAWVREDGPWHIIGQPGEPVFGSGWSVAVGQLRLRYRKTYRGTVQIAGCAANSGANTTVCTLPPEYTPATIIYFPTTCHAGGQHYMREAGINPDGRLAVNASGMSDCKFNIEYQIGVEH